MVFNILHDNPLDLLHARKNPASLRSQPLAKGVDKVTEDRDPDGFAVFFVAEEITPIKQPAESHAQGGFAKDQMLKTNTFVQRLVPQGDGVLICCTLGVLGA